MKTILNNIGRRGAFLLLLGLAFVCYGVGVGRIPTNPALNAILTLRQWSYVWFLGGALTLIGAFLKSDRCSFAVAAFLSCGWSFHWAYVSVFHHIGGFWYMANEWVLITGIILLISGWPECVICAPHRSKKSIERDRE